MKYFIGLLHLELKKSLSFRSDSLVWIFTSVTRAIINIIVIITIFSFIPTLKNFNANECILIYSIYLMVIGLFYAFFNWTLFYSNSYLINGKLTDVLIKPVNPLLFIIGQRFAFSEIIEFFTGFVLFIYSIIILKISILKTLSLLLLVGPGTLSIAGIFIIVASIARKFPKIDEAFNPLMSILDFAQYPVSIYPNMVKFFLTWIFPISLIAFYPASIVLEKEIFSLKLLFLPIYGLLFFIIGYLLFVKSVRDYESTGN